MPGRSERFYERRPPGPRVDLSTVLAVDRSEFQDPVPGGRGKASGSEWAQAGRY